MTHLSTDTRELLRRERGQTMAEYAVVLAVITLAIVGTFTWMGGLIRLALGLISSFL